MRCRGSSKVVAGLALAFAAYAPGARAQLTDRVVRAEQEFHRGEKLFDDRNYPAACPAFAESLRLDPQLGALLNLAFCHEAIGMIATAWREYAEASAWASERGQNDRQAFAAMRAAAVAKRLNRLQLDIPDDTRGYAFDVDGHPIERAAWTRPIFLDPGDHVLRVSAPQHRSVVIAVRVPDAPGDQTVVVPPLEVEGRASSLRPVVQAGPDPNVHTDVRGISGVIALGAGAVGLGLGSYFGVVTLNKKSDVGAHCVAGICDALGVQLQSDAHSAATASTIAFAAGAVSLGAGLWLLLTDHAASATALVRPMIAPTFAGLGAEARW